MRADEFMLAPAGPLINRCRWALVTERLSNESARQTSFTAMQVPRVRICHASTPGEPDAGDPPVRFGGRGRPRGLLLPL